jgi:hypothetical protein
MSENFFLSSAYEQMQQHLYLFNLQEQLWEWIGVSCSGQLFHPCVTFNNGHDFKRATDHTDFLLRFGIVLLNYTQKYID